MYFCEFCLSFYPEEPLLKTHLQRCKLRHPPGNQIYRSSVNGKVISMWEVDGYKSNTYCENLSYLAKLFLDHKLLYFCIKPFLYYVLTE